MRRSSKKVEESDEEVKVGELSEPVEEPSLVSCSEPVFIVAPGKCVVCKAGKLRNPAVVTPASVGPAFDSLLKSGAIVAK